MMCQYSFIKYNKYTTVLVDIDKGKGYIWVEEDYTVFGEAKTVLKIIHEKDNLVTSHNPGTNTNSVKYIVPCWSNLFYPAIDVTLKEA
jgi:hypothetical protein